MAKHKKNRNQRFESETEKVERDDRIEMRGVIEEALPSTFFMVKAETGNMVLCTLAGKLRVNRIRLLPGDPVTIEVSPYDLNKGRVTWRGK